MFKRRHFRGHLCFCSKANNSSRSCRDILLYHTLASRRPLEARHDSDTPANLPGTTKSQEKSQGPTGTQHRRQTHQTHQQPHPRPLQAFRTKRTGAPTPTRAQQPRQTFQQAAATAANALATTHTPHEALNPRAKRQGATKSDQGAAATAANPPATTPKTIHPTQLKRKHKIPGKNTRSPQN